MFNWPFPFKQNLLNILEDLNIVHQGLDVHHKRGLNKMSITQTNIQYKNNVSYQGKAFNKDADGIGDLQMYVKPVL